MRLAIVGAGPAGILLAHYLRERFPNAELHVLEAGPRACGQAECAEHDGISHPYGTCYTHLGYREIHKLIEQTAVSTRVTSRHIHVLGPEGSLRPVDVGIASKLGMLASVVRLMLARRAWQRAGQESAPSGPENALPFTQFMRDRRIAVGSDLFRVATTGQLYGPPETITTYNALQWFTPALFVTAALRKARYLQHGFDAFFNGLLASTRATLSCDSPVAAVVPQAAGVQLLPQRGLYDACFVTAPLDRIETPVSERLAQAGPYADQHVMSLHVRLARQMPQRRIYAFGGARHVHVISAVPLGDDEPRSQLYWVLARFTPEEAALDDATALEMVLAEMDAIGRLNGGFGTIDVIGLRRYRYNIHYSAQQLAAGLPQTMEVMQGQGGVWYGGGALSHWNVESIAVQSRRLAERFAQSATPRA